MGFLMSTLYLRAFQVAHLLRVVGGGHLDGELRLRRGGDLQEIGHGQLAVGLVRVVQDVELAAVDPQDVGGVAALVAPQLVAVDPDLDRAGLGLVFEPLDAALEGQHRVGGRGGGGYGEQEEEQREQRGVSTYGVPFVCVGEGGGSLAAGPGVDNLLPPHVQQLLHLRHHLPLLVHHLAWKTGSTLPPRSAAARISSIVSWGMWNVAFTVPRPGRRKRMVAALSQTM